MRDFVVTAGLLFLFFTFTLSDESEDTERRAGKIFYVTTTSSISTVSTATFCFVQETQSFAPLTCGKKKRKKRAVKVISDKSVEDLDIHPSSIYPEQQKNKKRPKRPKRPKKQALPETMETYKALTREEMPWLRLKYLKTLKTE